MEGLYNLLENCPANKTISEAFVITNSKIKKYDNIECSISGGADSDILIDILTKLDSDKKIKYIFVNPGLEYQATLNHIKELEKKYVINIETLRPKKPIPICCKEYGQPFISKNVSKMISRLQKYHFEWEDDSFENLVKKYCIEVPKEEAFVNGEKKRKITELNGKYYKGCVAALKWWCNQYGEGSKFNIAWNSQLKEFMIENPPTFPISALCCYKTKKDVIHNYIKKNKISLNIYGVRKAEGGIRSSAYKSCFSEKEEVDEFRPLFWMKQEDKAIYEAHYNISHSACYQEYGLKRTGCVGCPFSLNLKNELNAAEKYEPKLYRAICSVFGDSYKYTEEYLRFKEKKKEKKEEFIFRKLFLICFPIL